MASCWWWSLDRGQHCHHQGTNRHCYSAITPWNFDVKPWLIFSFFFFLFFVFLGSYFSVLIIQKINRTNLKGFVNMLVSELNDITIFPCHLFYEYAFSYSMNMHLLWPWAGKLTPLCISVTFQFSLFLSWYLFCVSIFFIDPWSSDTKYKLWMKSQVTE